MAVLSKADLFPLLPVSVRNVVLESHGVTETGRLQDRSHVQQFVDTHGIVTLFAGTELPSIQEAIAGELGTNTGEDRFGPGYGIAWIWSKDVPSDGQSVYGAFFRDRATLVARRLWACFGALGAPDYRRARKSKRLSADAFRIAAYIDEQGPTRTDVLRENLGFEGRPGGIAFRRARRELEKQWTIVVVKHGEHVGGADTNTWELTARWMPEDVAQDAGQYARQDAMAVLAQACVESALVVEEQGVSRWFGWSSSFTAKTVNRLLNDERIARVEGKIPLLLANTLIDLWPSG